MDLLLHAERRARMGLRPNPIRANSHNAALLKFQLICPSRVVFFRAHPPGITEYEWNYRQL